MSHTLTKLVAVLEHHHPHLEQDKHLAVKQHNLPT